MSNNKTAGAATEPQSQPRVQIYRITAGPALTSFFHLVGLEHRVRQQQRSGQDPPSARHRFGRAAGGRARCTRITIGKRSHAILRPGDVLLYGSMVTRPWNSAAAGRPETTGSRSSSQRTNFPKTKHRVTAPEERVERYHLFYYNYYLNPSDAHSKRYTGHDVTAYSRGNETARKLAAPNTAATSRRI